MAEKEIHELYYERASTGKRLAALLFDTFTSLFVGFLLLMLVLVLLQHSPIVLDRVRTREDIALTSGLYVRGEEGLSRYLEEVLEEDIGIDDQSEKIDERLSAFYAMDTFFPDGNGEELYRQYKDQAKTEDDRFLFVDGERALVNDDDDKIYLEFYKESYEVALGYLLGDADYARASRDILLLYTFSILGNFLFPFWIFFLVVPLFFRRTRQTFGMKLTRLAVVSADGLSVKTGKFIGRFLFLFVVEIVLSLAVFLTPFALSLGMMVLGKTHQSLHDYVFNTYVIFLDKGEIYRDEAEYRLSLKRKEGGITLEDSHYRPVDGNQSSSSSSSSM